VCAPFVGLNTGKKHLQHTVDKSNLLVVRRQRQQLYFLPKCSPRPCLLIRVTTLLVTYRGCKREKQILCRGTENFVVARPNLCRTPQMEAFQLVSSDQIRHRTIQNFWSHGTKLAFRVNGPHVMVCLHGQCFQCRMQQPYPKIGIILSFVRCRMRLSHPTLKNIVCVNRPLG
jgi:hypothetical protein